MSDARWTEDEDGDLVHARPDGAYDSWIGDGGGPITTHVTALGLAALRQCVRDADTLSQARELARTVAGFSIAGPRTPLGRLLDLLTGGTDD
jgi:hypothetical protein